MFVSAAYNRSLALAAIAWAASSALATGPSARPGIGAIPYTATPSGVTFRTFAPNADSVAVSGTFNFWSQTQTPLANEGNGYWSTDVPYAGPGSQYKFVVKRGTATMVKNDPRARDLTNSSGNSIVYNSSAYQWSATDFVTPDWNDLIIYEAHVGTFAVEPGATPPATLDKVKAKLDYLQNLGVNALEFMPICEFPTDISWGYNNSYPFAIESAYGTPDDFKELVDAAHSRGIAVFTDVVFSHLGPNDLDQWRFDGWYANDLGGVFFYNDSRAYTPWGNTRPDYSRPEVRSYIRDSVLTWLEEFRADGIRMDGTKYIRRTDQFGVDLPEGWSLLAWINNQIDAVFPGKLIVAEDLDLNPWLTKPTGAGGAGFDSQWDPAFYAPVRAALISSNDGDRNMYAIRDAINFNYNGAALQRVIYTESHDEVANGKQRVPEEIWPGNAGSWYSRKRSTLGGALVMTSPGIPMLFMGQEFLENGWFADSDPLDWAKLQTYSGIHRLYKDLIRMRRNMGGCTAGLMGSSTNVFHVDNSAKVIAFHRYQDGGPGDDVIVMMNFSSTSLNNYRIGLPHSGLWRVIFNSDWNGYSADYANAATHDSGAQTTPWDGLPFSGLVSLAPYSCAVFTQGTCNWPPESGPPEDLTGDGLVNGADLAALMAAWGQSGSTDLDGDGTTAGGDLARLLGAWAS